MSSKILLLENPLKAALNSRRNLAWNGDQSPQLGNHWASRVAQKCLTNLPSFVWLSARMSPLPPAVRTIGDEGLHNSI